MGVTQLISNSEDNDKNDSNNLVEENDEISKEISNLLKNIKH